MPLTPKTYELYLYQDGAEPLFEPLLSSKDELMTAVRRIVQERQLSAIEVRYMGEPLFTVAGTYVAASGASS